MDGVCSPCETEIKVQFRCLLDGTVDTVLKNTELLQVGNIPPLQGVLCLLL